MIRSARDDVERAITGENRLDDMTFLASLAFLAGVMAPFVDGRVAGITRLLPAEGVLAFGTVLLGSAFYYGYGSGVVSFAAGVRLSGVFEPFARVVGYIVTMFSILGGGMPGDLDKTLSNPPAITIQTFYTSCGALLCGAILCVSAARFGASLHYDRPMVGTLVLFALCALGLHFLGAW